MDVLGCISRAVVGFELQNVHTQWADAFEACTTQLLSSVALG